MRAIVPRDAVCYSNAGMGYATLQAAPGNRIQDFGGGIVAGVISSPLGVALDFAGLMEDINDEFDYYFPDAVKRRDERFSKVSKHPLA